MTELRTLKVALLGCGNVGAQVARILIDDADALAARTGARAGTAAASRCATSTPSATSNCRRSCSPPTPKPSSRTPTSSIELMGGIEPARTLILDAPCGNGACVVTGNKALLAAGRPRRSTRKRTRPACSCPTRPPWPAPSPSCGPSATACPATGSPACSGIVNGTTNFILDQMDSTGAAVRRRPGRGPAPRLRGSRPHGRRRRPRRRRQGRDPRLTVLPHPVRPGRRLVRGHHVGHRRGHRRRQGRRLRHQAAGDRRETGGRRTATTGVSVRVHPTLLPARTPPGRRPRCVQRRLRRGRERRRADVLRPGCRRHPDRVRRAGRPRLRGPPRCPAAAPAGPKPPRGTCPRCPSTPPSPATTSASTSRTSPASWPGSPSSSPSTACPSKSCGRPSTATPTPTWNRRELRIVTHRAPEAALAATVEAVKGLDVINSVTSVLRVEGV